MNRKAYEEDLRRRQKEHLDNIERNRDLNWQPCMHDSCMYCIGTGLRSDGTPCLHMMHCPCPKCSPVSYSTSILSVYGAAPTWTELTTTSNTLDVAIAGTITETI